MNETASVEAGSESHARYVSLDTGCNGISTGKLCGKMCVDGIRSVVKVMRVDKSEKEESLGN